MGSPILTPMRVAALAYLATLSELTGASASRLPSEADIRRLIEVGCLDARAIPSKEGGVRLIHVASARGDPLFQAGVHTGDVLLALDDRPVQGPEDVRAFYAAARTGAIPQSLLLRRRGRRLLLSLEEVDLGAWRCARGVPNPPTRIVPIYDDKRRAGFEVVELSISPGIVPAFIDSRHLGWKFVGVGRDSPAGRIGFRSSDRIVAIDGRAVDDAADVIELREAINAEFGPHQVEVERRGVRAMVEWWW